MLCRLQNVYAFFRSRTRAWVLANGGSFNLPRLQSGYGQKLWKAALGADVRESLRARLAGDLRQPLRR